MAMKFQLAQSTFNPSILTVEQLGTWLERQAGAASAISNPFLEAKQGKDRTMLNVAGEDHKGCGYCDKDHTVIKCEKFKKLTVDDRWKWALRKKVCFGCLSAKHAIRKCKSKECGIGDCQKKYNPLLHFETRIPSGVRLPNSVNPSTTETPTAKPEIINVVRKPKKKVFLSIVPVTLSGPDGEMDTLPSWIQVLQSL